MKLLLLHTQELHLTVPRRQRQGQLGGEPRQRRYRAAHAAAHDIPLLVLISYPLLLGGTGRSPEAPPRRTRRRAPEAAAEWRAAAKRGATRRRRQRWRAASEPAEEAHQHRPLEDAQDSSPPAPPGGAALSGDRSHAARAAVRQSPAQPTCSLSARARQS